LLIDISNYTAFTSTPSEAEALGLFEALNLLLSETCHMLYLKMIVNLLLTLLTAHSVPKQNWLYHY